MREAYYPKRERIHYKQQVKLYLDPITWGYMPEWWDKLTLINAHVETAVTVECSMLSGNIVFIHRKNGKPISMAAIGSIPFDRGNEAEGFFIVTAAAD